MFVSTKTATKFNLMETKKLITVQASISAPVEKVWQAWTQPQHITQWNQASPDWHCPKAENDLRDGGKFSSTMAARDGSMSFDFEGTHSKVEEHKVIESAMGDGRTMKIQFSSTPNGTQIMETFEAEGENSVEMQRAGWQAILDNFKQYTEKLK
jgi:uncharacterized protein YndB with AHSA1/START domain